MKKTFVYVKLLWVQFVINVLLFELYYAYAVRLLSLKVL